MWVYELKSCVNVLPQPSQTRLECFLLLNPSPPETKKGDFLIDMQQRSIKMYKYTIWILKLITMHVPISGNLHSLRQNFAQWSWLFSFLSQSGYHFHFNLYIYTCQCSNAMLLVSIYPIKKGLSVESNIKTDNNHHHNDNKVGVENEVKIM